MDDSKLQEHDWRLGGTWTPGQQRKNDFLFALARAGLHLAEHLPTSTISTVTACLADLAWLLWRSGRKRADSSLERVFGELHPSSRQVFAGMGWLLADMIELWKNPTVCPSSLVLLPEDKAHLDRIHQQRSGAIFVTAHLGPWERMAAVLAAHGYPTTTVARTSYDPRFQKVYDRLRNQHGVRVLYRPSPGFEKRLIRALRHGQMVGFLVDLGGRQVRTSTVPWFGEHGFPTPEGPARLALRLRIPVLVGTPAPHGGQLKVAIEAIPIDRFLPDDVQGLTEFLAAKLAERIRNMPWLWPWMHPFAWQRIPTKMRKH
jgi:Kdo2-lipid IVA lauroyltransferase/acyltransferase